MGRLAPILMTLLLLLVARAGLALEPGFSIEMQAALPVDQKAALSVARQFLAAVSDRDLDGAMARVAVPFIWDREQIAETSNALRQGFVVLFEEEIKEKIVVTADEIYPAGSAILGTFSTEAQKFAGEKLGKGGLVYFAFVQDERIALLLKKTPDGHWLVVGFED